MSKYDDLRRMREAEADREAKERATDRFIKRRLRNPLGAPQPVKPEFTTENRKTGPWDVDPPHDPTIRTKGGTPKRGRPKDAKSLSSKKPWEAAGMSRAQWYRRQKEKRQ
jgi:hypothetical protein